MRLLTHGKSSVRIFIVRVICFFAVISLTSCNYFESTQTRLKQAKSLYQKNQFNQVIVRTKRILQSDARNCQARILLGKSQFAKVSLDEAEESLRKALDGGCRDPTAFTVLVKVYLDRNELTKASKLFDNPKYSFASKTPEALLLKGNMYFLGKKRDAASVAYSDYYALTHNQAQNCLSNIKINFLDKNYQKVIDEAQSCDAKFSKDESYTKDESLYLSAMALVRLHKPDEAVHVLENTIGQRFNKKNPFGWVRASLLLVRLYLERNQIDKAVSIANTLTRFVVAPDIYYAKGRKYELEHRLDLAEQQYLAALKLDARFRPVLLAIANLKFLEGNYEQARYYAGRADDISGSDKYTRVLTDRQAIRNIRNGDWDAVIQELPNDQDIRSQYLLALAYAGKGESKKAWKIFEKIKKQINSHVEEDFLEARLNITLGNLDNAKDLLKNNISTGNLQSIALLSQIYLWQGDYEAAENVLQKSLNQNPSDDHIKLLLVEYYSKTSQKKKLFHQLNALIEKYPENNQLKLYLAKMFYKFGEYKQAVTQCDTLLLNNQSFTQAYLIKAGAYIKLNESDNAEKAYKALLKQRPDNSYAYLMLAVLAQKQSRLQDALTDINHALALNPKSDSAIKIKIDILLKLSKQDKLMRFARASAGLFSSDIESQPILGYAYLQLGDDKQAYARYRKALNAGNKNPKIALILYKISNKLYGENKAEAEIDNYLSSATNKRDLYLIADYFLNNKKYKLATKCYSSYVKIDKTNPAAFNNLAWLMLHNGDLPSALDYARLAYKFAPKSPAILDTLGQVLLAQGKNSEAGIYLLKAHEMQKNNPVIGYHLAQYYYLANQLDKSRELLSSVVGESFPEQQAARDLLLKISK